MITRSLNDPSRARTAIGVMILLGIALRAVFVPAQGYGADVQQFADWGERVAELGPERFYARGYFADYPPALLYLFWLLGAIFDGEALRLAIKSISIPFDAAIALATAGLVWRWSGPTRAIVAAALWSFAPAAVIGGAYWGQVDSVGTVIVLGALLAAGGRRWVIAGGLAGLASVTKFQLGVAVTVIVAAVAIEAAHSHTWRPFIVIPAAAFTALLVSLPFGLGPFHLVVLLRFASAEYEYTSLFAFNIWSILVGFFQPDAAYVAVGGVLLGVAVVASCALLSRRRDARALVAAGALTMLAFYFLPTRAHERYLIPAIALLVPFAAARSSTLASYLLLSVVYAFTLFFALAQNGWVVAPVWMESTLFTRPAQIAMALVLMVSAAACAVMVAAEIRRTPVTS